LDHFSKEKKKKKHSEWVNINKWDFLGTYYNRWCR